MSYNNNPSQSSSQTNNLDSSCQPKIVEFSESSPNFLRKLDYLKCLVSDISKNRIPNPTAYNFRCPFQKSGDQDCNIEGCKFVHLRKPLLYQNCEPVPPYVCYRSLAQDDQWGGVLFCCRRGFHMRSFQLLNLEDFENSFPEEIRYYYLGLQKKIYPFRGNERNLPMITEKDGDKVKDEDEGEDDYEDDYEEDYEIEIEYKQEDAMEGNEEARDLTENPDVQPFFGPMDGIE